MQTEVDNDMEDLNPLLQDLFDNLEQFCNNLDSLYETFEFSFVMLKEQVEQRTKDYNEFVGGYTFDGEDYDIPENQWREYYEIGRKKDMAERALDLIPASYLISLVSMFDSFYASLVKNVYNANNKKLLESEQSFSYRDLCNLSSIDEIKKIIIERKIDTLLRDSHTEQISWLEKAIGVKTLKAFSGWPDFIELTERRNLFVHTNGYVSSQYINICKSNGYDTQNVSIGEKLKVSMEYFKKSYCLLYQMGFMLTHIQANKLCIKDKNKDIDDMDTNMIDCIFELICRGNYPLAISLSDFAMNKYFKHSAKSTIYFVLNKAQALKWNGQEEECLTLLSSQDSSAWNDDFLIPKYTLEQKYEIVFGLMEAKGDKSEILNAKAYREWPIFKEIRKEKVFEELFEKIFNEHLNILLSKSSDSDQNAPDNVV